MSKKPNIKISTNDLPTDKNWKGRVKFLEALTELEHYLTENRGVVHTKCITPRCKWCDISKSSARFRYMLRGVTYTWDKLLNHAVYEHHVEPPKDFIDCVVSWYSSTKNQTAKPRDDWSDDDDDFEAEPAKGGKRRCREAEEEDHDDDADPAPFPSAYQQLTNPPAHGKPPSSRAKPAAFSNPDYAAAYTALHTALMTVLDSYEGRSLRQRTNHTNQTLNALEDLYKEYCE